MSIFDLEPVIYLVAKYCNILDLEALFFTSKVISRVITESLPILSARYYIKPKSFLEYRNAVRSWYYENDDPNSVRKIERQILRLEHEGGNCFVKWGSYDLRKRIINAYAHHKQECTAKKYVFAYWMRRSSLEEVSRFRKCLTSERFYSSVILSGREDLVVHFWPEMAKNMISLKTLEKSTLRIYYSLFLRIDSFGEVVDKETSLVIESPPEEWLSGISSCIAMIRSGHFDLYGKGKDVDNIAIFIYADIDDSTEITEWICNKGDITPKTPRLFSYYCSLQKPHTIGCECYYDACVILEWANMTDVKANTEFFFSCNDEYSISYEGLLIERMALDFETIFGEYVEQSKFESCKLLIKKGRINREKAVSYMRENTAVRFYDWLLK